MDIGKRKRVIFVEPLKAPEERDPPAEPAIPVKPGAPIEKPPEQPEQEPEPATK